MLFVGVTASLKRLWLATFLGRRSYKHYGPELEVLLSKMIMVSQLGHLARQIQEEGVGFATPLLSSQGYVYTVRSQPVKYDASGSMDALEEPTRAHERDRSSGAMSKLSKDGFGAGLNNAGFNHRSALHMAVPDLRDNRMSSSARLEISQMLDEWEEPGELAILGSISLRRLYLTNPSHVSSQDIQTSAVSVE